MTNSVNGRKVILVTGGCGYLGSQLIRDLVTNDRQENFDIRVLDNMQGNNYRALMNLPTSGNYHFVEGDILDPAVLDFSLRDVDIVIHLAAVAKTPLSFENPTWVEQINNWGTARLIESCIDAGVERVIFASSTAVYGPGGAFNEKDVCRPFGAYAQSKLKAERKVQLTVERGLKPIVLRFGTLFGFAPSIRFDAVANRFAYLVGTNRSIVVHGRGDQVRPFIHVKDASRAIQTCINRFDDLQGEIINVVGTNASVSDLVTILKNLYPGVGINYVEQDVLTHISIEASNNKLLEMGFSPQISLASGLQEICAMFNSLDNL